MAPARDRVLGMQRLGGSEVPLVRVYAARQPDSHEPPRSGTMVLVADRPATGEDRASSRLLGQSTPLMVAEAMQSPDVADRLKRAGARPCR